MDGIVKCSIFYLIFMFCIFGGLDLLTLKLYYNCINIPYYNRIYNTIEPNPRFISNNSELYIENDCYTLTIVMIPFQSKKFNLHTSNKTHIDYVSKHINIDQCNTLDAYSIRLFKILR